MVMMAAQRKRVILLLTVFLVIEFVGIVSCYQDDWNEIDHQPPSTKDLRSFILKNLNNWEHGVGQEEVKQWLYSADSLGLRRSTLLNMELLTNHSDNNNNNTVLPIKKTVVSKRCLDDMNVMLDAATSGEEWALKVADSFAKPPSGILEGNTVWLGSFDECRRAKVEVNVTGRVSMPYKSKLWIGQYCTSGVAPVGKESQPSLTVGVCLSSTCTSNDTEALINRGLLVLPGEMVATGAKCQPSSYNLTTSAIIVIVILSFLGCIIVVGTTYDLVLLQLAPQNTEESQIDEHKHMLSSNNKSKSENQISEGSSEKTLLINGNVHDKEATAYPADITMASPTSYIQTDEKYKQYSVKNTQKADQAGNGILGQILLCFSVYSNVQKLFSVKKTGDTIECIHGIRFISMTWVILGHSFFFAIISLENISIMPQILKRWTFLLVENSSLAVDTFFLLSGLLSSYLLTKKIIHRGGPSKINWPLFYFHRYWRLTPPYMLLLAANATLFVFMGNGPQWPWGTYEQYCQTHWWTNLLYVNNIVFPNTQCMASTWYLANDMQYFVIMPLLVVGIYKSLILGVAMNVVLMLASFIATALITVANSYPPTTDIGTASRGLNTYFPDVYIALYTRIGPYLIGIIVGYILLKTQRQITIHKCVLAFGWLSSAVVCLATVYGPYGENAGYPMSASLSGFYAAVHRTAWAMGISWIILACFTNNGGAINRFLSWPGFVPLSRLTYMAYLVHPIVLYYYLYRLRQRIYYDDYTFMYIHLGNLVMSYGVALVASLSLEAPMIGLEKVLVRKKKKVPTATLR